MTLAQRRWSVRRQLLLLILVFVLSGTALFAWLFANDWRRASADAHARVKLLADSTASRLAAELHDRETLLRRFAERPLVRALDPGRCDPLIGEYIALHPEFAALGVRDMDGRIICAYHPNAQAATQVAAFPWVQQAARSGGFRVGSAFVGPVAGRWVSALTYPILDDRGRSSAWLILAVDLLDLQRRVIGPVPDGALVVAADRDGNIVLRSHDQESWLGKPAPPQHVADAWRQLEGFATVEGVDGMRRLYAHATVSGADWLVLAGLPETEVYAEQRALLARSRGIGLAVLALVLMLAGRIARAVVEPIKGLAEVAARVAHGDLDARARLAGPAEIDEVARQFNDMLDARDRSDEERKQAAETLRERERFVSTLVGNLPGMVYRCLNDPKGTMVYVSDGCKIVTGYERNQLENNREVSYADLVHPDDRDRVWSKCQASLDARQACNSEYRIVARGGPVHWVWERATGIYAPDGTLSSIVGFVQDISEHKEGQALMDGQKRVLEMIAAGAPLARTLAALAQVIEAQAAGEMLCSVLLLDPDGVHLRHGAAPSLPEDYVRAIDGVAIGSRVGSCGTAAFRREAVIVEDIATDPLWADYRELALRHGLRACWSTPIPDATGGVLGTFGMYYRRPGLPTAQHQWLIDVATQTAAVAISRHAVEGALRESMLVLENTFEYMDQGISISNAEQRVVGMNRRFRELLDFPERLCKPNTPTEAFFRYNAERGDYGPGDVEEQVRTRLELSRRREAHRFERERPDGSILEIRGTPLPAGGFVTIYTDITQRARSERESIRFRAALNLSSDGVYLVDCTSLTVLDCNDGACRALGYARHELVGSGVERIFADRTRDQLSSEYAKLASGDASETNFEALHRRKDGSVFPVEINRRVHRTAEAVMLVGVARDITERKQAEAALRDSAQKLSSIVENALDAAVRMDAAGLVVGWNAQAERTFGWSPSEATGRALQELIVPPQYRDAHARGMRHFLATGEGPALNRRLELSALRRDGSEFPVELTVTPIRTKEGYEFNAFIRDLSAAQEAEAARNALEAQLRESQKMEAIGTLAGGIAHDFNNILGAILGNTALARDEVGAGHPAMASLEQVHKAGLRARGLVQQILAFSRRQTQQLVVRPLRPLVEESLALLRATLPAGVALDARLADEPLHALTDATQMQQVLMNLCTNAWHALPGGRGRIVVGLEPALLGADAPAQPGGLAPGRYAHLWVSDDGCGMDASTRTRLFEPFFTTKAVGHGTGLGLAVVHGIVAAHHGAIHVDSSVGRGSTFHLHFPLVDAAETETHSGWGSLQLPQGRGERVLYIDDDEVMVLLAKRLLERAGYRVTCHSDPHDALAAVSAQPDAFDVVVSDYNMPGLSGLDLARAIMRIRPGLPVIIGSGMITDAMRMDALAAGVPHLMHKENAFAELAPLVQRALAEAGA